MIVSSTSTSTRAALVAAGRCTSGTWAGQPGQEPGRDRVELADVTEGERAQERTQRRGRVRALEHPPHPAVPQQGHVIDAVGAGDHPRDQRGDLQPGVRALVARHAQVLIGQQSEAPPSRPAPAPGPARRTTPDSDHRTPPTSPSGCERVSSQRCPSGWVVLELSQVPISHHGRAFSLLRHAHPPRIIGGSRLSGSPTGDDRHAAPLPSKAWDDVA